MICICLILFFFLPCDAFSSRCIFPLSSQFWVKVPVCTDQRIFSSSMWKSVIGDLRFLPVALLYIAELLERVPCMCPLDSLSSLDLDSLPVCLLISRLYKWHFCDHRQLLQVRFSGCVSVPVSKISVLFAADLSHHFTSFDFHTAELLEFFYVSAPSG